MKIVRPSKPEVPFKRKRSPPPQATKLLRYAFLSGVVFMVLLAIVFLPRMFVNQEPVATPVVLAYNTTRLDVVSVGAIVSLTKLRAILFQDNAPLASLGPPLDGGNSTFSFVDANGDGFLGPGDYFPFSVGGIGCHRAEVIQFSGGSTFVVGRSESWGGCPPS
jgi:hypothetical protein